jgi:mannan endo-1,4-beta-mannosidase
MTFLKILVLVLSCSYFNSTYGQVTERPAYNKGKGFFVANGKLYDKNGFSFIPYGFNSVHAWLDETKSRNALRNEINKSGANCVRLVTGAEGWIWAIQSNTPKKKRELVELAIQAELVPVIEVHDGTGIGNCDYNANGKLGLKQIVEHWLLPENVKLLNDYEEYVILNIANEWGPNDSSYFYCYKEAITRLRKSGVNNLIMIDAGGNVGQNPASIINYGESLLETDPQRNLMFSVHAYAFWRTNDKVFSSWTPPNLVETTIPKLAKLNVPVMIGEFGWETSKDVNYNPRILMRICRENNMGWFFWTWFDGAGKPWFNTVKTSGYNYLTDADLTDAGGYIVNDPENGLRNVSKPATIFPNVNKYMVITDFNFNVQAELNKFPFSIHTKEPWRIETNSSWINFDKTEGIGDETIQVTIAENTESTDRVEYFNVISGNLFNKRVTIKQSAMIHTSIGQADKITTEIYPNPFSENLYIKNASLNSSFSLYSSTGQVILKGKIDHPNLLINTVQLPGGIYHLSIKSDDNLIVKNLIKW